MPFRLVAPVWILLAALGCARSPVESPVAAQPAPVAQSPAPAAPPVGMLERRSLTRIVEQPGRVEPFAQTPMLAKIAGYVNAVKVDIGDEVKAGQLLAEIDVPELREELKQKQALVAQAVAEVEQAKQLLAAAEANITSATAA